MRRGSATGTMRAVLRMMTLWVATVALGCVRVSAFWAYELGAHSSPQRDAYLHQRSAQRMAAVHARLHGHVPNRTEWLAAQQKGYAQARTAHARGMDMEQLMQTVPGLRPPRKLHDPDPVQSLPLQVVLGLGTGRCGTLSLWKLLSAQDGATVTHEATQGGDAATRNHSLPAPTWTPLPSLAQRTRVARAHLRHYHAMAPPAAAAAQADPHSAAAASTLQQRLVGDVWSAHLPYAEQYLKLDPTAKLVVLERPRSEVVASFANKSSPRGATEAQCMAAAEGQPRCRNHWQQWRAGVWWDADNWDAFFPNFPGKLTRLEAIGRYWDMYAREAERLLFKFPMAVRKYDMEELLGKNSHATQREMLRWLGVQTPRVRSHWHANPWQEASTYDDVGEAKARLWASRRRRRRRK